MLQFEDAVPASAGLLRIGWAAQKPTMRSSRHATHKPNGGVEFETRAAKSATKRASAGVPTVGVASGLWSQIRKIPDASGS